MRIVRLELLGYQRLLGNNIKHFIYTPTTQQQLILGTNGSGKSSILSELSPLPGHRSNYSKDGFKKITIEHQGRTYQLDSVFKNNKHSFVVDGEELNPGGTAESQKVLVYQHFNINKDIHDLLTGEVRLTRLAPIERRKWITLISQVDYGYALGTFKRIASRSRDQQGALKHLNARLSHETQVFQAFQDIEGLRSQEKHLREELNVLMLERIPNLPSLQFQKDRLTNITQETQALAREYFRKVPKIAPGWVFREDFDVHVTLDQLNVEVESGKRLVERIGNECSDLESVVQSVVNDAGEDLEDLPLRIEQQSALVSQLRSTPEVFKDLSQPSEIQRDWQSIHQEVQILFRQLPDNRDRRYTHDTAQRAREAVTLAQGAIDHSSAKLEQIKAKIDVLNEAKETQCPSCHYVWRPGYSEEELAQLHRWQDEHVTSIESLRETIRQHEQFLEESDHYGELYKQFRGFVRGYPRLAPLWDYILSNQLLLDNPSQNGTLFVLWQRDLTTNVQREQAERLLAQYREIEERRSSVGDRSLLTQRLERLQNELVEATGSLQTLRQSRDWVSQYHRRRQECDQIAKRLEDYYAQIVDINRVLIDALRNDVIDEAVTQQQNALSDALRKLSEYESQEGVLKDLQQSKSEVDLDAEALSLLVKALSPNEGLIAEQLDNDIGCLVAQINSIIASVWTYDMSVQTCSLETGELDYRFPVQFAAADNVVPDVAKTSKGQCQMIDFAFQLTAMLYLNLTDYPLFLDEPGEGFDEQHRVRLMDFVKQLMDTNRHSQLFMISHYASGHGSFTNAEVLVLDSSNISVPGTYNQHAVLA